MIVLTKVYTILVATKATQESGSYTKATYTITDIVTRCMVEWCTQNLRRNGSISRGTSHATATERYQYTTSVDINNTRYKRIQSLIQNREPVWPSGKALGW